MDHFNMTSLDDDPHRNADHIPENIGKTHLKKRQDVFKETINGLTDAILQPQGFKEVHSLNSIKIKF